MTISPDHFSQVDMRVGRIVQADDLPQARRPSFRLLIDFGPLGIRKSSAGLSPWYIREDLVGRLVVAVVNLPPRQVAHVMSEVLVLGAVDETGRVTLLRPDRDCPLGSRVS